MNLTFVDCPNIPIAFKIIGTIYLLLGMMTTVVTFLSSVAALRPPVASVTFRQKEKNTMDIKNVTVAGGGVLGSQIVFQSAYCGFNVTV